MEIFTTLIDDLFVNICIIKDLQPINNKRILSIVNDFEDGKWRVEKFHDFIWENIEQTALSANERKSLIDSSRKSFRICAKNLRLTEKSNSIGSGSELAEIILYGIMKNHYKALPVVPKIFYKQNSQDNAKGADSVHIVIENNNDFSIWFGEAKFFNSIENTRLNEIITSVENSLNSDKIKKENSIITGLSDLDILITDSILLDQIKTSLNQNNSLDNLKAKLNIPILLLHECSITKSETSFTEEYKNNIKNYHKERAEAYFRKQIIKFSNNIHKYSEINFHIILFPVPNNKELINKFTEEVNFYRGNV